MNRKPAPPFPRIALLVALAPTLPAAADEGRIPIWQATTISQAGSYVATRDVTSAAGPVLTISASDVTVDLGGHTLSAPSNAYVVALANGVQNVTIRNGVLTGGLRGVDHPAGAALGSIRLERLVIRGVAEGVTLVSIARATIEACTISSTTSSGLWLQNVTETTCFGGRVFGNEIRGTGGDAIHIAGCVGCEIAENRIADFGTTQSGSRGIAILDPINATTCGGNLLEKNLVDGGGNSSHGIDIGSMTNIVRANVVKRSGGDGIRLLSSRNQATGNVVADSLGSGIYVSGGWNLLDSNSCLFNVDPTNPSWGINFASGSASIYRDNLLKGNKTAAVGGLAIASQIDGGGNL